MIIADADACAQRIKVTQVRFQAPRRHAVCPCSLLILVVIDKHPHHLAGILSLRWGKVQIGRLGHAVAAAAVASAVALMEIGLLVVHSVAIGYRTGGVVSSSSMAGRWVLAGPGLASTVLGVVLGTGPLHLRLVVHLLLLMLLLLLLVHRSG